MQNVSKKTFNITEKLNSPPLEECLDDSNDALLVTTKIDDGGSNEIFSDQLSKEVADSSGQDSCFGWVVVAASFGSCWIIGVTFIAFSILYMDFSTHFESPYGVAGWIGSLYLATGNILGSKFVRFNRIFQSAQIPILILLKSHTCGCYWGII